ncbi:hypothetical protein CDCA_CDCA07G2122 [Cyanidium caldarium]|uniref:3-isopropylmalate dehydrogenase n=1 Tax=Cyanidium caldarium TaxID=2771 RepID=A0AAV9IUT6_CYACA|nr:hypothetical protein CDCA_CDCA07G2122 [Cyanidium caldarium]
MDSPAFHHALSCAFVVAGAPSRLDRSRWRHRPVRSVCRRVRMQFDGAGARPAPLIHHLALLPGDGIGPEIMAVARQVLDHVSRRFDLRFKLEEHLVGGAALDALNEPLPEETLAACARSDGVLLACIGGPKWDNLPREKRPESGLLALRKGLEAFANLRPAKSIPQLIDASPLKPDVVRDADVMVVRELTGDVYFGEPRGLHYIFQGNGEREGLNTMIYTETEVFRVARVAFEVARKRQRKRLCSVDKANVLESSQLWRECVTKMATTYPDVELSHLYVDNAAMQLVRAPRQFDTIVTGNLFGDILSDEASMLVGSLGMLPSASLGDGTYPGVFEPVHGSAPDIAGQDKANPLAMVLSVAMLFRYQLNRSDVADTIDAAVNRVLDAGYRTADIMSGGMRLVGCREMGDAVERAMSE